MSPEELKIIADERQGILNGILEELQTKSLKDLFSETRDKEDRVGEVKDVLEKLYDELRIYERWVKNNRRQKYHDYWVSCAAFVQDIIGAIEKDYSNYIQGGYGYISVYLDEVNESESEEEEEEVVD